MMHKRTLIFVLVFVAATQTLPAQAPSPVPLADVQRLKCIFTLLATGTWDNGPTSFARQWLRNGAPIGRGSPSGRNTDAHP